MKKTLLLVDGSSYLYRAYHAMPNLRNADGEPTGALYGVLNMMRRLTQDCKADWMACIFDAPGKTFRDELYPEYKANRATMPDDLALQIQPIHTALRALGWPVISIAGVEADDVIGTLATQATQMGVHTIVSTGDKDLAQLVNDKVTLVNTMNGENLDEEGVRNKFGVPAERIVDYLMLVGDTVDNIPGVDKVGPKTAAKWLNEYGSLDGIIDNAAAIKGVAGNNLREAVPRFGLSRELVTVKTDCELPAGVLSFNDLKPQERDTETLVQLFDHYGFRSWLRELTGDDERIPTGDARVRVNAVNREADVGVPVQPVAESASFEYETVNTVERLHEWLRRLQTAELVALDTETCQGLGAMECQLVGISLATEPGRACYIPLAHRGPDVQPEGQLPLADVLSVLKPWLEDAKAPKLLHHAKFDTHALANAGVQLHGIVHDTMLQAYVLESHRSVSLQELGERWLGRIGTPYETLCGKGASQIGFDEVAIDVASHYACEDADFTLQLHRVLYPQVQENPGLLRIYQLEVLVSRVLAIIERHGVSVDVNELSRQSQEFGAKMLELEQRAYELAGQPFNLNSPKQLGEILFGRMGLPVVRKTPSGAPSTDEEVLTRLAQDYPLPQVLLEYRSLAKLKSTYTDKLARMVCPSTRRIHTSYAQAAVITGRLASSEPNLQNIPVRTPEGRRIRQAFVAEPGHFIVSADYSQIELRVMAHVSDDANLQAAFQRGDDIHSATAAEVFGVELANVDAGQRRAAKAINFGLMYGMSAFGLAANLGITRDAAQMYIDRYFARYPGVAQYMHDIRQKAHDQGYVETVFGRRLWLPEIRGGSGPRRKAAERAAINAPMQGTAADLIKMAMVAVQNWLDEAQRKTRLIMQVHDELVFEVPQAELQAVRESLPDLMCKVAVLKVPLLAEVGAGNNWDEAH